MDTPRARILGGRSSHNGGTASVGAAFDYDEWADQGNPGWTADAVLTLLEWAHQKFRVRRYPRRRADPAAGSLRRSRPGRRAPAGRRPGRHRSRRRHRTDAGEHRRWCPLNAAFAFLDPVRHLPNLTIAASALVGRVLVEDGTVTG